MGYEEFKDNVDNGRLICAVYHGSLMLCLPRHDMWQYAIPPEDWWSRLESKSLCIACDENERLSTRLVNNPRKQQLKAESADWQVERIRMAHGFPGSGPVESVGPVEEEDR